MPNAVDFLSACSALQEASAEAKQLPGWATMAAFAAAELIKLGFLIEMAHEHKVVVPEHVNSWATKANEWAVKMHGIYKTPTQTVNPTHIAECKKFIVEGRQVLLHGHKALPFLAKAEAKLH